MKKVYLLLTMTMLLAACGNKQTPTESNPEKTDSAAVVAPDTVAVEALSEEEKVFKQFFDQFTFDKFVDLLRRVDKGNAQLCGLSFIYEASDEGGEEGDVGTSVEVYGWGIEKGKKNNFGYELTATSDHAVYFYYQLDTSTQAAICFKNKDDADRFFEKGLAYGLVEMNGDYHIAEQKLSNGTVKVDSFRDYDIFAQITKPQYDEEYNKGYYVIHIYYFS